MRATPFAITVGFLLLAGCKGDSVSPAVATAIEKLAGDGEVALVGSSVSIPPSVRVVDQRGDPMPGELVVFSVTVGGGQASGVEQVTDANGIATVGSWRLGLLGGENVLSAATTTLAAVHFTVTAEFSPLCSTATNYTLGSLVQGELLDTDCLTPSAFYYDFYQFTPTATTAIQFDLQSNVIDPYLRVIDASGNLLAENDDIQEGVNINSRILFIAAPTTLQLAVTSFDQLTLGTYALGSQVVSGQSEDCGTVFVMRGITTQQSIVSTDCLDESGPFYLDQYFIRLRAGTQVTIRMNSTAFDTYLELWSLTGEIPLALNNDATAGTTNSLVTYTATQNGYYALIASSWGANELGAYQLIIDAPPAAGLAEGDASVPPWLMLGDARPKGGAVRWGGR